MKNMQTELRDLISNINLLHVEDVFAFFEISEDILLLKYDGIRSANKYTMIIMGKDSRFETIRYEGLNLREGLRYVLSEYATVI
jgi:hypothetical protein